MPFNVEYTLPSGSNFYLGKGNNWLEGCLQDAPEGKDKLSPGNKNLRDALKVAQVVVKPLLGQPHMRSLLPDSISIACTKTGWKTSFGPRKIPDAILLQKQYDKYLKQGY